MELQNCVQEPGERQYWWRIRTELAANTGTLARPSSHRKDQRDTVHAFQTESGSRAQL